MTYLDGLKLVSEALDDGGREDSSECMTVSTDADNCNPFANLRYCAFGKAVL